MMMMMIIILILQANGEYTLLTRGRSPGVHMERKDYAEAEHDEEEEEEEDVSTEGCSWLPPSIPASLTFQARGTFVDVLGHIFVQLHENRNIVRTLESLLNEKFSNSSSDCALDSFQPGQMCCARSLRWSQAGTWYRARFLRYDSQMELAVVFLIDYGDITMVNTSDLRSTIYGERVPSQALAIVLHNLLPIKFENETTPWDPECLDFIQHTVNYKRERMNRLIEVEVVGPTPTTLPLPVNVGVRKLCTKCSLKENELCGHENKQTLNLATLVQGMAEFNTIIGEDYEALNHPKLQMLRKSSPVRLTSVSAGTYDEECINQLLCPLISLSLHEGYKYPPSHHKL